MSKGNTGLLFYRRYYSQKHENVVQAEKVNPSILEADLQVIPAGKVSLHPGYTDSLVLTTSYPGLTIGVGYNHDAQGIDSAFKIGFQFDHSTGMPLLPGSSVKGTLRSMFPNRYLLEQKRMKAEAWQAYSKPRYQMIGQLTQLDPEKVDLLELELFGGVVNGSPLSIYQRDIFLDAVPVEIGATNFGSKGTRLFGDDYITPHIDRVSPKLSAFANPEPLKFLKVMPDVKYAFRFILHSHADGILDATQKLALFRQILLFKGIGAKTNTGYGQFAEGFEDLQPSGANSAAIPAHQQERKAAMLKGRLKQGMNAEATVIHPDSKIVSILTETGPVEVLVEAMRNLPPVGSVLKGEIQLDKAGRINKFLGRGIIYLSQP